MSTLSKLRASFADAFSLARIRFLTSRPNLPSLEIKGLTGSHLPSSSPIVFTAVDDSYLRRFGPAFFGSLAAHMPNASLHVHLYNPTSATIGYLETLAEPHADLQVTWSEEEFNERLLEERSPAGPKQSWRSLYICCTRFIAAYAVLQSTGRSILLLDVDLIINDDLMPIFDAYDCAFMTRLSNKSSSTRTAGGVVFVAANKEGAAVLAQVCDTIGRFIQTGRYWFAFDQLALYRAYLSIKTKGTLTRFRNLTASEVAFDLTAKAPIVSAKGRLKASSDFVGLAARAAGNRHR
jgi:hypothetical protein